MDEGASVELSYLKFMEMGAYLPKYTYTIVHRPDDKEQKIYLQDRKFYTNHKIKKIHCIIRTKLDSTVTYPIDHSIEPEYIEITNTGTVKVIKYTINLPPTITEANIDKCDDRIEDIKPLEGSASTRKQLQLTVSEIPARKPDQPGRIRIPLKSPIPS